MSLLDHSMEGKLRLVPEHGTTEGFGLEGRVKVYESSIQGTDGQRLLTICANRDGHPPTGLRLTRGQAADLYDFVGRWLEFTA